MLSYQKFWDTAGISSIEKARFHFLNLCVVRFVVEKHGGTMDVASKPERGTQFKICLPVA